MRTATALALGAAAVGYTRPRAKRKKLVSAVAFGIVGMLLAPRLVEAAKLPPVIGLPG